MENNRNFPARQFHSLTFFAGLCIGITPVAQALAADRAAGGPFRDVYEMCSRLEPGKLSKLALDSLARSGAMASLCPSRARVVAAVDQALEWGARIHRDRQAGQTSLFGEPDASGVVIPPSPPLPAVPEFSRSDLLSMEKDRLGAYLSGHPLGAVEDQLRAATTATLTEVAEGTTRGDVIVGGIITSYRKIITRRGRMMAFVTLEDLSGVIEATVLSDAYEKCGAALVEQAIILVRGRAEADDRWREDREAGGQYRLLADAICPLDDDEAVAALRYNGGPRNGRNNNRRRREPRPVSPQPTPQAPESATSGPPANSHPPNNHQTSDPAGRVHIRVSAGAPPETVGRLKAMIDQFHGDTEVLLHIQIGEQERRLRLGRDHLVARDDRFTNAVRQLLGEGAVWVE